MSGQFGQRCVEVLAQIVEKQWDALRESGQQRQHDLTHLRMRGLVAAQLEDVSPFPDVGRGHDLGLEAVGQDASGLLGRGPGIDQAQVGVFAGLHCTEPQRVAGVILRPEIWPDDGDLAPELVLGVVGVTGALLGKGAQVMVVYNY